MDVSKKICIIGGTGFIGTKLVEKLLARGMSVRLLSRCENPPSPPKGAEVDFWGHPNIEFVRGEINDIDSLRRCMEGCSYLFHLVAYAKNWAPNKSIYEKINVIGMRNVFTAAKAMGMERTVWTSTIVTFGPTRKGVVGDETMPRITNRYFTEYEETKTVAEREALAWAANGFPLVIVNPSRVYGPGQLTEGNALTRLIDEYDRGKAPIVLNAGVNVGNYVLVDDVAEGHILAMEKGQIGQRYILGGENASLYQFLTMIDTISGKKHLKIPIFRPGALFFSHCQKKRARWLGIYPRITPGWVRTFLADWAYSSEKAKTELGYDPTPLREGLTQTYHWLLKIREQNL